MYAKFDTTTPAIRRSHRHRKFAAAVLAGLAVLAAFAVAVAPDGNSQPAGFRCEETTGRDLVTGSGAGDTTSGPSAILGFQDAYYTARSADQARQFLTSNSVVGDWLQAGIAAVAPGTRYCVRISPRASAGDSEQWAVTVTEHQPGADPDTWTFHQAVTTRTVEGVTLISEIAQARPF